jgi:hypothetical protein
MKKSTLGLNVCLVIAVIVSIAAVIYEKRVKAEKVASDLRDQQMIEDGKRMKYRYSGDCMHEPPEPVPVATRTNVTGRP